jgi:mannosyltransferase
VSTSDLPARGFGGRSRIGAPAHTRSVSADVWILCGLIVVAIVIRIITIDNQSLWADEALTAYEAHLPFGAMLGSVVHVETTPPLYFVLIWGWAKLFGTGEVALRSLSTLAGIALVPIAYLSARDLISRWAGVIAAAFVTVNPFLIWYSQEARAYMLLALLTGASFWWFIRARSDLSRRNLAWWAVCSSAAVMTHFFAGFVVGPEALWLLWVARTRMTVLAVGVVAAAQLAMLPFAVGDTSASHGVGWIAAIPRVNRIATTAVEWAGSNIYRRSTTAEGLVGGAALIAIVALLLLVGGDRQTRQGAKVAGAITAFAFVAPLALGLVGQDYFLSRNEIPAFIPMTTVVAAACVAPRARWLGGALAVVLLVLFSVTAVDVQTHPYLERPDWRNVARALGPATVPRAILAADGTTADPLKIYLPGVTWSQPHDRLVMVKEVDVVGATKRLRLVADVPRQSATGTSNAAATSGAGATAVGSSLPRSVSPPAARLLSRFRVDNWIVARFALARPERINIDDLRRRAGEFFRRTPVSLLVFVQPAER